MSRHGLVHAFTPTTHKTNATPHVADTILSVLLTSVPVFLFLRRRIALLDIFGYMGTSRISVRVHLDLREMEESLRLTRFQNSNAGQVSTEEPPLGTQVDH